VGVIREKSGRGDSRVAVRLRANLRSVLEGLGAREEVT
jgi:hypothetical protein